MNYLRIFSAVALITCAFAVSGHEDAHEHNGEAIEEIVIMGHPLSAEGLATPADVLANRELKRKLAASIGATIANEPGIHSSSFGVAVGRPVIHGLGGARVRVMEDRIDAMDVSVTSGDHAVTVDPFIADRVEIFKGSGTLLYGSGAIGGVVDTHTGRIPHTVPEKLGGKLSLGWADNADAGNGLFRLDGGAGSLAWHLDGFRRDADDYEIPGFAESALLRSMEEEHEEEGHEGEDGEEEDHDEEEEEAFGVLPGSGLDVQGGSAGLSLVGDRGFIGVAVSNLDAEYGIPGHGDAHGHGEEGQKGEEQEHEEEGTPFIDLKQTRVDFEAALADPLPGFLNLNVRLGVNDYEHAEVGPSGEVGTAFDNQAWEARVELTHGPAAGWEGAFGLQLADRSFTVVGEEAFTPPVDTSSLGVFWVGQRSFEDFEFEAGVRLESVELEPAVGDGKDFSTVSASLGAIVPLNATWTASVLADYSSRAPVGEELFSEGPHLATQSFEIGNPEIQDEQALNFSATLRGDGARWSFAGTVYYTSFADFIYQAATGEERDGLIVRRFAQADATFTGLDLEASVTVAEWGDAQLELTGLFDMVSAELDVSGNDNLPRIPPSRAGIGLQFDSGGFSANLDYLRASKQDSVADYEFPTEGYEDLRVYLSYEIETGKRLTEVYLRGRNLTGDEQRKHTSIIKDLAPDPSRTIEAGVRFRF